MKYWDSSAIVPLLLAEQHSRQMQNILARDSTILTWWGTEVECSSAISRLERDQALDSRIAWATRRRLQDLSQSWNEIEARTPIKEAALRLLRVHPLHAADSLHLAAALVATNHRPPSLDFVCLDKRLCAAAELEGFTILPSS